jgi:RimJ/RimL family protein N-acetyltransferase
MWKLERPADRTEFLGKSHIDAYRAHLLRLEPEARAERFHASALEAFVALHARAALTDGRRVVIGYFADGVLRGAGELLPVAPAEAPGGLSGRDGGVTAATLGEFSLSIERDWRGRGIGSAIMGAMIQEARWLGIKRIEVVCLRNNVAMQRLAARFSAELTRENGTVLGIIEKHRDLMDAA